MNAGTSTQIHYPLAEWLEDLDYYARKLHYEQELAETSFLPPEVIPWVLRRPGLTQKMYEWRRNTVRVGFLYLLRHLDKIVPGPEDTRRERELQALTQYGKQLWPWIERHGLSAQFYHLPINIVLGPNTVQ